ncbi:SDR family NAD(P)-dependent oxidoreductase [Microlunatus capsulatus]|uniref:NAD(P)-dependent dehydrogenase (Short-subunit alcohol dehydrogenase family) n=1 Tax=Microlunatus capsulatus TaxID=99117 RepID=A0ABS4Z3T5_9ACTN|nr:SDR family NAD(P)-dependent oxidoreductase [Microlunatus capsulatus]MBP2415400.1 NAD(P)-dependent dehydrogenase (short-subunit alcohol dehydrogenase family) [Microlunatus capsulatus]
MTTVLLTGATDGIGRATAALLLSRGHDVLVHARSAERGAPVLTELADRPGTARLVTGDLSRPDEVHALAAQVREAGGVDSLVHNAGVWVRGATPARTADGVETTLAVNVLAPHLLTALLGDAVRDRVVWLGSGMAGSGRPDPERLGEVTDPQQAYRDSKACDVALAVAWGRRRPDLASAALDPGWVPTKLASPGATGRVQDSAESLAFCALPVAEGGADLATAPCWKGHGPARLPGRLRDDALVDALAAACDRLTGLGD